MTLTIRPPLPALFVFLTLLASAQPAYAASHGGHRAHRKPPHHPSVAYRLSLYSPRVRRSTVEYLRLRLLELREEDLDRASLAIEHRLSIDELLAEPRPHRPADGRGRPPHGPVPGEMLGPGTW